MSGISFGSVLGLLVYGLIMAGLAFFISLVLKRRLSGSLLVLVSVSLMTGVIFILAAMGMAQSDFTFKWAAPIFALSAAIAIGWLSVLKLRALRHG